MKKKVEDNFVIKFKDGEATDAYQMTKVGYSGPIKTVKDDEDEYVEEDVHIGEIIDKKYKIIKKLGGGGMGDVYLGQHVIIGKKVAIKILHRDLSKQKGIEERFLREARAASKIEHENIIDVSDYGSTTDKSIFIVMEYLKGEELRDLIKREVALSWSRAKSIIIQICRGLSAAHEIGIFHRDIKPANIYLIDFAGKKDFVKIIDFGIAKISNFEGEQNTKTGTIMGTPDYMSPEQGAGRKLTHHTDIYSVGVILYEMITGSVPFKADSFMGVITKHIFEEPVTPSVFREELQIKPPIDAIILKALAKKKENRFDSMDEFIEALEKIDDIGVGPKVKVIKESRDVLRKGEPSSKAPQIAIAGVIISLILLTFAFFKFRQVPVKTEPQTSKTILINRNINKNPDPDIPVMKLNPKVAEIFKLSLKTNVKGGDIFIHKGVLRVVQKGQPVVWGKGAKLGTLPLTDFEFMKGEKSITLRVFKKGYKELLIEMVPNNNKDIEKIMVKSSVVNKYPMNTIVNVMKKDPVKVIMDVMKKDPVKIVIKVMKKDPVKIKVMKKDPVMKPEDHKIMNSDLITPPEIK
jgi:serine/threonine protein kinase